MKEMNRNAYSMERLDPSLVKRVARCDFNRGWRHGNAGLAAADRQNQTNISTTLLLTSVLKAYFWFLSSTSP